MMIMQKIYALVFVGISVTCSAGEHFDTEQNVRKRHEQIKETTREVNQERLRRLRIEPMSPEKVKKIIAALEVSAKKDGIELASDGHYTFEKRDGQIVAVKKAAL